MYNFNYCLSEKDYLEFNIYHIKNAPSQKRAALIIRLPAIALLIVTAVLVLLSGGFSSNIIFGAAVASIFLFGWDLIMRIAIKSQIKLMKRDGRAPYDANPQISFGEEEVHEISETSELKVKYVNVEKVCDDKKNGAVYIFFSAMQAFILPHRAFESDAHRSEFLAFINGKVPNK
jgi:hypothetical protein